MIKKNILLRLRDLLIQRFPGKIEKIILFGSRAYGSPGKLSDYDLLIILRTHYDWRLKKEIQDTCWEIDYEYDILTDVKLISTAELQTIRGKQPYITDAVEHGIAL